jgi:glycosyltransferase involved in cell wall biosynthesis
MSVYNQEDLLPQVLDGIFKNTITPFNLILVFDGCTDRSEAVAREYLQDTSKFPLLRKLTITQTANLYETLANNVAWKLGNEPFLVTLQDDMIIREYAWEKRLTYPIRKFDDIFAVTARGAQDLMANDEGKELYEHTADKSLGLPRNYFAVRDVINRGPVAFDTQRLKTLGYLNEAYAPCNLDDADLSLRAWTKHGWRCGAFSINYASDTVWGKARSADSTMPVLAANHKNLLQLQRDHREYLRSGIKHSINYRIEDAEIQQTDGFTPPVKESSTLYRKMVRVLVGAGLYSPGLALLRASRRLRFGLGSAYRYYKATLRGWNTPAKTTWITDHVNAYATQAITKRRLRSYLRRKFAKPIR